VWITDEKFIAGQRNNARPELTSEMLEDRRALRRASMHGENIHVEVEHQPSRGRRQQFIQRPHSIHEARGKTAVAL
jgi:hypothetical protein